MLVELRSGRVEPVKPKDHLRFLAKTGQEDERGCWPWEGAKSGDGHGTFTMRHELMGAHRFAFEVAFGPIPVGLVVRHDCDNAACVNVRHLRLGTLSDNSRDMAKRGRQHMQKLSADDAREIRRLKTTGLTNQTIADTYGVDRATIGYVVRGDTHREEK